MGHIRFLDFERSEEISMIGYESVHKHLTVLLRKRFLVLNRMEAAKKHETE